MTDKLLPCPFCGGEAEYLGTYIDEDGLKMHQVGCSSYPSCIGGCYAIGSTKEEAIELWNKRPNPWHTGTPTEEGWYLIQTKRVDVDTGRYIFKVGNLSDVLWFQSEGYKELSCYGIVAWQKIEPYEASKERE